jgi:hypothetical protein
MRSLLLLVASWLCVPAALAAIAPTNDAEAIVLKHSEARNRADPDALLAVLSPDVRIYERPVGPHRLVGLLSAKLGSHDRIRSHFRDELQKPQPRHEVVDMVSLADLVVSRIAVASPDNTPPDHMLTAFRVRDGAIDRIWHIAMVEDAAPDLGADAQAVTRQLQIAANRADADGFVGLFHDDAQHFHPRRDPSVLGGAPSPKVFDRPSRTRAHREMFANGPTAQVRITDSVALGEWVADIEEFRFPDGRIEDHLTMNRVRDGLILDTWHLADQKR